jgi:hypothetical protein
MEPDRAKRFIEQTALDRAEYLTCFAGSEWSAGRRSLRGKQQWRVRSGERKTQKGTG